MRILHYTEGMENPTDSQSLDELIKLAKRTHELVDAVDLKKVAAHDQDELGKVAHVKDALTDLEQGKEVLHVDGVDSVVPQLDAEQQRVVAILNLLADQGWSDRIGRVLHAHHDTTALRPLDLIPHYEGLPEFDVCIAPNEAAGAGNFALLISDSGIFAASVGDPPDKHTWRIHRSRPYDSEQELLHMLKQFSEVAFE